MTILFSDAVLLHYKQLLKWGRMLTKNAELSEDLVQDLWISANRYNRVLSARHKKFMATALYNLYCKQRDIKRNNCYDLMTDEEIKILVGGYSPTIVEDIIKEEDIAKVSLTLSRLKSKTQATLKHAFQYESIWEAGVCSDKKGTDINKKREAFKQDFLRARTVLRRCYASN